MGLRLLNGARKPAYDAYKLPIWVSGKGAQRDRLRPGPPGRQRHARRPSRSSARPRPAPRSRPSRRSPVTSANGTFTADGAQLRRPLAPALERRSPRARRRSRPSEARARRPARARGGARRAAAPARRRPRDRDGGRGPDALQPASRSRRGRSPGAQLGVDVVRIHARWWEIAPERDAASAPSGFNAAEPQRPALQLGQRWTPRSRMVRDAGMRRDAHDHRPRAAVGEQPAEQAQPALEAVDDGLRRVLARRRDALQGPGRPLPDLERAQPAGLAAAAVGLRQPPAQLQAGLAARLPRAGARGRRRRSTPPTRARRSSIGELAPIGNDADLATTRR